MTLTCCVCGKQWEKKGAGRPAKACPEHFAAYRAAYNLSYYHAVPKDKKCMDCGRDAERGNLCIPCHRARRNKSSRDYKKRERLCKVRGGYILKTEAIARLAIALVESCDGEDCGTCIVDGWCGKAREGVA